MLHSLGVNYSWWRVQRPHFEVDMKYKNYLTRNVLLLLLASVVTAVVGIAVMLPVGPVGAQEQHSTAKTDLKDPLSCAALKNINLPDVHITAADTVDIQSQWGPGGRSRPFDVQHPFCRVQGVIETVF